MFDNKKGKLRYECIKICAIYSMVGFIWVSFSDRVAIEFAGNRDMFLIISTYKGWLFVTLTSVLLYQLINSLIKKINLAEKKLNESYAELSAVNEELEAYVEQLTASEEELRAQNEQLIESENKLEYLCYNDQLTGIYNRRFFEEVLSRIDEERSLPLTIVMGDVNGLKLVNDSFGHAMGDELLKKVVEVMKKGCRNGDIVARLAGDEFVILLPKTDVNEARQIIKKIKALALKENVDSVDISISFGYETKTNKEEKIEDILKKAEDHMYKRKLFESPSMRGKTVNAIITTLHEKNKREEQHSCRVSKLCERMGMALGLPEDDVRELKTVGLLHDIGKIAIEENILNKKGKLTNEELGEVKRHPEIGYRILSTVNDMSEMAEYVLAHHERWDGMGYPKALKGEKIPIQSRIIAIADSYDAMVSERSYRNALSEEVAIEEIKINSGMQFDPKLVNVFIGKVLEKPV
jgi:diguanylate cyclase (GGDEF)-like protein